MSRLKGLLMLLVFILVCCIGKRWLSFRLAVRVVARLVRLVPLMVMRLRRVMVV